MVLTIKSSTTPERFTSINICTHFVEFFKNLIHRPNKGKMQTDRRIDSIGSYRQPSTQKELPNRLCVRSSCGTRYRELHRHTIIGYAKIGGNIESVKEASDSGQFQVNLKLDFLKNFLLRNFVQFRLFNVEFFSIFD